MREPNILEQACAGLLLGFAVIQFPFLVLWLAQSGANKIISTSDVAKNWEKCNAKYIDEEWFATTTSTWNKVIKDCGRYPYFHIF